MTAQTQSVSFVSNAILAHANRIIRTGNGNIAWALEVISQINKISEREERLLSYPSLKNKEAQDKYISTLHEQQKLHLKKLQCEKEVKASPVYTSYAWDKEANTFDTVQAREHYRKYGLSIRKAKELAWQDKQEYLVYRKSLLKDNEKEAKLLESTEVNSDNVIVRKYKAQGIQRSLFNKPKRGTIGGTIDNIELYGDIRK